MIKTKYINISLICIFLVCFLFYFAFIYNCKTIVNEEKCYPIFCIEEKQNLADGNYHYFFIFENKDGKTFGRTTQPENIPWDSINVHKCQLIKYYHNEKTLVFNPITFDYYLESNMIYNQKEDRIIYKSGN